MTPALLRPLSIVASHSCAPCSLCGNDERHTALTNIIYLQHMKKIALYFLLFFCVQSGHAQTAEDSVKAVVNRLFNAMKSSDAAALSACFASNALLQSLTAGGNVRTEDLKEFAKQIASLPKDSADERIVFETVKVDANLAIVWAPYRFYYAGKFSHCGVDSFQLIREGGQWKIHYLVDTRRRDGCQ
jgi:hypothetical protein